MSVVVPTPPEKVSIEDLINVYSIFCREFGLDISKSDKEFFKRNHEKLLGSGTIEYKIGAGYKFFIIASSKDTIEIWADYLQEHPKFNRKYGAFYKKVEQYFEEK